jgi:DNA invertase Pin-like site-specific DNA recombinase
MATAYSYIRFSTAEQLEGDSLRRQAQASAEYAKRKGLTLDTSLKPDKGISGFHSRNRSHGALGRFLKAVEDGSVKKGSVLIVESLDRLSRDEPDKAFELIMSILRSGISITTLTPFHEWTKRHINDLGTRVLVEVYVARAHEESATKSYRRHEAWNTARAGIAEKKMTRRCPAWLELNDDRTKFIPIPEKVALVKRIFKMSADGHGLTTIVKTLNQEGIPSLARVPHWQHSYVMKILRNRAVIGEYQPHLGHWSSRKPHGDPKPGYYPAIIDTGLFYRVQDGLTKRKTHHGRQGKHVRNLFTGLIRDDQDNCTMTVIDKGDRSSGPALVSNGARRGSRGSKYVSFPYDVFENAFLRWTTELSAKDILPSSADLSAVEEQLEERKGTLADLTHRITKAKNRLLGDGDFDELADVLRTLETRKKETEAAIEKLTAELQSQKDGSLAHAKHLIQELNEAEEGQLPELRIRLKGRIAALVKEIRLFVSVVPGAGDKELRTAVVRVLFDGGKRFTYVIVARRVGVPGLVLGTTEGRERWPKSIEDFFPSDKSKGMPAWAYARGKWYYVSKRVPEKATKTTKRRTA